MWSVLASTYSMHSGERRASTSLSNPERLPN
uniref:Uncharacterized protein n=1 Tax=Anguilla anguilla TaxID=7936 RepID=A0A0E9S0Q7_ANGAN